MHFADRLLQAVETKKSPLCLGLDPHWALLPEFLKEDAAPQEAIVKFLCPIIEATAAHICAVKPQLAFFEVFGSAGFAAFEEVCRFAKEKDLLVIVDGKRNDIGSTAEAYAEAYLRADLPYDALTVTPYLGQDGIMPFVEKCARNDKGIFILVKTSNPSAGEFQDLPVGDELLHEHVARKVALWGEELVGKEGFSAVGAVVGATYPEDLKLLRQDMPQQIFLLPGFGAQGATAGDLKNAFYANGSGAIVNSARDILFAWRKEQKDEKDFVSCAVEACKKIQVELWEEIFET